MSIEIYFVISHSKFILILIIINDRCVVPFLKERSDEIIFLILAMAIFVFLCNGEQNNSYYDIYCHN